MGGVVVEALSATDAAVLATDRPGFESVVIKTEEGGEDGTPTYVVGFKEAFCYYFNKYHVTDQGDGKWLVKTTERGAEQTDVTGFPPRDQGFSYYNGPGKPEPVD